MARYKRKSFGGRGLVRINLSKSGIGMSIGAPGFRVGTGPRGPYVHAGRRGVYYRKSLSRSRPAEPQVEERFVEQGHVDFSQAVAPETETLVTSINKGAHKLAAWAWIPLFGAIPLAAVVDAYGGPVGGILLGGFLLAWLTWVAVDVPARTTRIEYDLDAWAAARHEATKAAMAALAKSHIVKEQFATSKADWKRNAGAGTTINARPVHVGSRRPPFIKTNVKTPSLKTHHGVFYFMPDYVLLCQKGWFRARYGAIPYGSLQVGASAFNYIDPKPRPRDARLVGHTWQYVRRDGGPDRRFNNNRQIPKYECYNVLLRGPGVDVHLIVSSQKAAHGLEQVLSAAAQASPAFKTPRSQ